MTADDLLERLEAIRADLDEFAAALEVATPEMGELTVMALDRLDALIADVAAERAAPYRRGV